MQEKFGNALADSLRFTIDIEMPENFSSEGYHGWAKYLTDDLQWRNHGVEEHLSDEPSTSLFINSHISLWQSFFDLGCLPIFDLFEIQSIRLKHPGRRVYSVEIDFLKLDFISLNAYQIPIGVALKITQWMAQNKPTPKNLEDLYQSIDKDVIKPMQRWVSAGQSTIPVLRVARLLGIPFMHIGQGIYQLGWGSKAVWLDRSSLNQDAIMGAKLSQNKAATANILRLIGLPAPFHSLVLGEKDAIKAAREIGFPLVVKPSDQDRGLGVTVGVLDESTLRMAFGLAQRISRSKEVIIERHVPGICHRVFVVGNQLLYAVKRRPIGLLGDGVHSIRELINQEIVRQHQKPLWSRSKLRELDALALKVLNQLGYGPDSIPRLNEYIPLRPIESGEWGGLDEDVTEIIHPANIQAAIDAAQALKLHVAGVDIISPDVSIPWFQNGAIINEVNHAPLLGGAEISRSYLPHFFEIAFSDSYLIPLNLFDDVGQARSCHISHLKEGRRSYFVSSQGVENPKGEAVVMPFADLRSRIKALMCRSEVDAVVALLH